MSGGAIVNEKPVSTTAESTPSATPMPSSSDVEGDRTRVPSVLGEKHSDDLTKEDQDPDAEGHAKPQGDVDVPYAEEQFFKLRRQLTQASSLRRQHTQASGEVEDNLEADDFDLSAYMVAHSLPLLLLSKSTFLIGLVLLAQRSQAAARDHAEFHHKELGVTFRDLEVIGAGGMRINIRRFPDAIKEFLMAPMIMVIMNHAPIC